MRTAWERVLLAQAHDAWITATTRHGREAWAFQVAANTLACQTAAEEITAASGQQASIAEEALQAGKAVALVQSGAITEPGTAAFVASSPSRDADMLIAVTSTDETNLVACKIAADLFNVPTRIARVRNTELQEHPELTGEQGFRATHIIWPEQSVTDYLLKLV